MMLLVWLSLLSIHNAKSLFKSEFWIVTSWSSILKKCLQLYRTTKWASTNLRQLWHWNGILRDPQVLIGQAKLFDISACSQSESGQQMHLQPLRFWFGLQELSHVLQRAVCHLAARIDNNVTFVKEWIIWAIVILRSVNSVSITFQWLQIVTACFHLPTLDYTICWGWGLW